PPRRRPSRALLFPYTTLFRSAGGPVARSVVQVAAGRGPARRLHPLREAPLREPDERRGAGGSWRDQASLPPAVGWPVAAPPDGEDRKSTRLNSSHVSISYAVF